jgi:hypothetical protein
MLEELRIGALHHRKGLQSAQSQSQIFKCYVLVAYR